MKNRRNTPNFEKCVVLLMIALKFAQRGGIFMNCPIVEAAAQPAPSVLRTSPQMGERNLGEKELRDEDLEDRSAQDGFGRDEFEEG